MAANVAQGFLNNAIDLYTGGAVDKEGRSGFFVMDCNTELALDGR